MEKFWRIAMQKCLIILTVLLLLPLNSLLSQPLPIVVKGKIADEQTGEPMGVDIEFRNSDGKKIKINSNSLTGEFQQVLNAGEFYEVILSGSNIIRKVDRFKVDHYDSYDEQEQNFTVKKLEPGRTLFRLSPFEKGSSQIIGDELESIFIELQEIMKFNRAVYFEFVVNAKETYTKAPIVQYKEEPKTKGKKKKPQKEEPRHQIIPDPNPGLVKELVDARIEVINKMLEDNSWKRYIKRLSVKADYDLGKPETSGTIPAINLLIVVKSLDSLMDKN